ncbi:MAG TPA: SET domain-containing protein-lysine N-methyltransferase [Crinalium sp.]|jgi:hypothetical protein
MSLKPNIEVSITPTGARLVATTAISQDSIFYRIPIDHLVHQPTYQTVQTGLDVHVEDPYLSYMNHSCDPNVLIDTTTLECRAIRPIEPLEELRFFYPSTEWDMNRPFICQCGSSNCLRIVAGAKYLALDALSQQFINRHIRLQALMCLDAKAFENRITQSTRHFKSKKADYAPLHSVESLQ